MFASTTTTTQLPAGWLLMTGLQTLPGAPSGAGCAAAHMPPTPLVVSTVAARSECVQCSMGEFVSQLPGNCGLSLCSPVCSGV
jgi:hypothetical protein